MLYLKTKVSLSERFLKSVSEADRVYVLDTGSTDDTVEKLRAGGAVVIEQTIDRGVLTTRVTPP